MEDLTTIPDFSLPTAFEKREESRLSAQKYEIQVISNEESESKAHQSSSSSSGDSQVPVKKFSIRNHLRNARSSRS